MIIKLIVVLWDELVIIYRKLLVRKLKIGHNPLENWPPPSFIDSVAGKVRIANLTNEPHTIKRNQHLGLVRPTYTPNDSISREEIDVTYPLHKTKGPTSYSSAVKLDPDECLSHDVKTQFQELLNTYDEVFNPDFKGYNGASGPLKAVVNMGPVKPPQRKGRLPQYNKHLLSTLQDKFDELETRGVFTKPELVNVNVEYVNPSFLVKKTIWRLQTSHSICGCRKI